MKLALVAPSAARRSPVGEHARALLPHLCEVAEVVVFVDGERAEGEEDWRRLDPQAHDRILYEVGNDAACAFMLPMVRRLGGAVSLHEWDLFEATFAACPAVALGGLRGFLLALREGGLGAARALSRDPTARPAFNRSIVRFADSFLVPAQDLKVAVLRDRNAITPVGVVERVPDWSEVARRYAELLDQMPPHRAKKRPSIATQVWRGLQAREAERGE